MGLKKKTKNNNSPGETALDLHMQELQRQYSVSINPSLSFP